MLCVGEGRDKEVGDKRVTLLEAEKNWFCNLKKNKANISHQSLS